MCQRRPANGHHQLPSQLPIPNDSVQQGKAAETSDAGPSVPDPAPIAVTLISKGPESIPRFWPDFQDFSAVIVSGIRGGGHGFGELAAAGNSAEQLADMLWWSVTTEVVAVVEAAYTQTAVGQSFVYVNATMRLRCGRVVALSAKRFEIVTTSELGRDGCVAKKRDEG